MYIQVFQSIFFKLTDYWLVNFFFFFYNYFLQIISKLVNTLRNVCVSDDWIYIPFVVFTSYPLLYQTYSGIWLFAEFLILVTRWAPRVICIWVHPWFLVGFLFINFLFSIKCFVDHGYWYLWTFPTNDHICGLRWFLIIVLKLPFWSFSFLFGFEIHYDFKLKISL